LSFERGRIIPVITKKVSSSIDGSSRKMPASFERKGFELCDSELEMQGFEPCRSKSYHDFLKGYFIYPVKKKKISVYEQSNVRKTRCVFFRTRY